MEETPVPRSDTRGERANFIGGLKFSGQHKTQDCSGQFFGVDFCGASVAGQHKKRPTGRKETADWTHVLLCGELPQRPTLFWAAKLK